MSADYVRTALDIATRSHEGQRDKAGVDYIEHPKTVAGFVSLETEKAAAYLHDVLEDTDITADDLINQGIPVEVVQAVQILTKQKNQNYEEYLKLVKKNPIARIVKMADLRHNSDLSRIKQPQEVDFERCEKYRKAIKYLG
ncbi:MAG: HD domain-containing protein [Lactobacillales bacterium]|jgi:(p)ppGpp synthase/HD superfamily hydrolase|nr:HD domain-containing protein [Lactobacillales bacterium]